MIQDRELLVSGGITILGKHIPLHSEFRPQWQCTVKIVLKDLLLHLIDNSQVLETVSEICEVLSKIFYGTLWHEGRSTSIRNGDWYFYIPEHLVAGLPDRITIVETEAMVINLHECPEGCIIPDSNHDFSSSEQYYQFKRLRHHGLIDKSYRVLEADSGFDAMKLVHCILPEDDVQPSWKSIALDEMLSTNRLKYQNCLHAKDMLMNTKVVLAEATSNEQTKCTLSDYWLGHNNMGKILVRLREDLYSSSEPEAEEIVLPQQTKRKASSLLQGGNKSLKL